MRLLVLLRAVVASGLAAGVSGAAIAGPGLHVVSRYIVGDLPTALLLTSLVISVVGLIAAAVVGLPVHALLARMGRTQWGGYVLAGLIAGTALGLLCMGGDASQWFMAVAGVVSGTVGGFTFWWIVRPDRPPMDAPS